MTALFEVIGDNPTTGRHEAFYYTAGNNVEALTRFREEHRQEGFYALGVSHAKCNHESVACRGRIGLHEVSGHKVPYCKWHAEHVIPQQRGASLSS